MLTEYWLFASERVIPGLNAALLATTRGVMGAGARSGRFEPLGPVSGADALVSIKTLRDELNVF